ncbi:ORF6N domain-containing protein [Hippea maritima]|uniref:KilA-N, DNA-binding domain protein n=1 Tax=Hippea maritima (strain ATCC 700847 / DSM 10411 / MH2) TaxID=760142 RepID=F2LUY3_HIPMA|nr:ORF6N domain-containing protein [Hippea maritima]AEA34652.1 KilA-N, DNA-binding domain protein [Hippea maritima DSM 10411]
MKIIKMEEFEDLIIEIRGQKVLLDSDVAKIYGVETKRVNEAVKNNPEKFPKGYIIELTEEEKKYVVENFDHLFQLKFSPYVPKAFTEKGLYMLATILKSKRATEATIAIIETFTKIRNLTRNIKALSTITDKQKQRELVKKSGEIISEIIDDELQTNETETTIELNFAVLKFKHTIKKKK